MTEEQWQFLENEIWASSFAAAFQHASVYDSTEDSEYVRDKKRTEFRSKIRGFIEKKVLQEYPLKEASNELLDMRQYDLIKSISDYSATLHDDPIMLTGGKLNIGVCQKLLNLYLKYSWCLGKATEPPHFPIDGIIQKRLGLEPISWTKDLLDYDEYSRIIRHARKQAKDLGVSLAQLELSEFENARDQQT